MENQPNEKLVGIEKMIESVFGTGDGTPSKRTVLEWKAKGKLPFVKVGRRVFYRVSEVNQALQSEFLQAG